MILVSLLPERSICSLAFLHRSLFEVSSYWIDIQIWNNFVVIPLNDSFFSQGKYFVSLTVVAIYSVACYVSYQLMDFLRMHILAIGFDHKSSSLAVREKLAIPPYQIKEAMQGLIAFIDIKEIVVLSTCNRFEIYACTDRPKNAITQLRAFFQSLQPKLSTIEPDYTFVDEKAVEHLFRVASGIESLILGETQILSQLKTAYAQASAEKMTGSTLSRLFQLALHCGKRVRHETSISKGAMSTGAAAVQLVGRKFGSWKNKKVLIIGAGKAGQMCVKSLLGLKDKPQITVLNQSPENIQQISFLDSTNSLILSTRFEQRYELLEQADAVFVTTASSSPIICLNELQSNEWRPEFIVDLSVPRNVESSVACLPGLTLFTLDELKSTVDVNKSIRAQLVSQVEEIIDDVIFKKWSCRYSFTERNLPDLISVK